MPSLALALLSLAPPTDSGVWLDAPPRPGTVVRAPLTIEGEAQALEGVLSVSLYVVRGTSLRLVETYEPVLPVGTVPFAFSFDPAGMQPGRVTVRVVATTLARGFRAEVTDLVVPSSVPPRRVVARPPAVVHEAASAPVARAAPARRVTVALPRVDDSGRVFGATAPTLPYRRVRTTSVTVSPVETVPVAAPTPVPSERSGAASVAAGLLLLVTCSHLHRALRSQPDPEDGR